MSAIRAEWPRSAKTSAVPVTSVYDLEPAGFYTGARQTTFDGTKFVGGFGLTEIQVTDYWTLRQRSAQLYNENLYARGMIRRLVTNEINTGLFPEAAPMEDIIGVEQDSLAPWTEEVENRFTVWGANPKVCDFLHNNTFGALQRAARMEALVSGDVLVVLRQVPSTKLPAVQLVNGGRVQTPFLDEHSPLRAGHVIRHGVELNATGRTVAFWVLQDDGTFKRLPAFGTRTGRKLAWLVYGTDKRFDDVRGQPLLSLVLQSLKEIDRYRDSAQRKAVINSLLAMYIKKGEAKTGTMPVSNAAVRKDTVTATGGDDGSRDFALASQIPGIVYEKLQHGEEPVGFHSQGIDLDFGKFEEAVIQAVAWANEIPPEILRLSFSNNYSASQAAINEFKIYLTRVWSDWGETFCGPIYTEWLISETLLQKISAPGLLEAWRDPLKQDIFSAWTLADWYGVIKPSTDMLKQAKASQMLIDMGLTTRAREARLLTGTRYSKDVQRLRLENEALVLANAPLLEAENAAAQSTLTGDATTQAIAADVSAVLGLVEDIESDAK